VADEAGVTWWRGAVRERVQVEDVRDVAFDATGRLWIGAGTGLYSWTLPGRPVRRSLRGGETANRIRRLAIQGASLLVASEQGAFWSTSGRIFQPLEGVAANDDYSLATFRVTTQGSDEGVASVPEVEAWLFGRRGLVRIRGMQTASGLRVRAVDRPPLPRPTREASATDLSISRDGQTLWVTYADALARRTISRATQGPRPASAASAWTWLRPVLPPGATIQRFVRSADALLLATDHGLIEAEAGPSLFRRVAGSAGTSNCADVRERDEVAIALCREGVFVRKTLRPSIGVGEVFEKPPASSDPAPVLPILPQAPPLAEIRRRALERSGLSVSVADSMRRGLARQAYWPEVALRLGADLDRDRAWDADQAFVSGDTRHLRDRSRDEAFGFDAGIAFEWDFGELAYPEDSVDLSRELRQVVSLRDDIADEINQLYFERQRIRARLARAQWRFSEEHVALYWRAREIDAGLDAWTGGWTADWQRARPSGDQNHHPGIKREEEK
jgi:hypothetical protein